MNKQTAQHSTSAQVGSGSVQEHVRQHSQHRDVGWASEVTWSDPFSQWKKSGWPGWLGPRAPDIRQAHHPLGRAADLALGGGAPGERQPGPGYLPCEHAALSGRCLKAAEMSRGLGF